MAAADSVISAVSSSIALRILDQLGRATAGIPPAVPEISFRPSRIFSSVDGIAFSEFSTNFSRAIALVATCLVGVDDESIGERHHRLELLGHFLGAERDRLQFGSSALLGDRRACSAARCRCGRALVLRDQRALFLDLEDFGKNLGEGAELALQLRDLLEPGRVGWCPSSSLEDGVLQAGLGRQRRLCRPLPCP